MINNKYNQHLQNNTFSTLFVGQNLIKLSEVDSTNNFLKELVSKSEPLPEGTVIMADNQYAGRGQQQNIWHTEPGKNLTFSVYLKPSFLNIPQQFLLNMAISIAVNEALTKLLGSGVSIKWPNDIYYKDLKLGGILIENMIAGSRFKSVIIGIGLNVNQQHFEPHLSGKATSVYQILHKDVSLKMLLTDICSHIESNYLKLKAADYLYLRNAYHNRLYRFHEQHKYRHNGEVFFASIQGVRDTGMLVLLEGETEKEYNFKEIEFLN